MLGLHGRTYVSIMLASFALCSWPSPTFWQTLELQSACRLSGDEGQASCPKKKWQFAELKKNDTPKKRRNQSASVETVQQRKKLIIDVDSIRMLGISTVQTATFSGT